jgi:hypothetical protein
VVWIKIACPNDKIVPIFVFESIIWGLWVRNFEPYHPIDPSKMPHVLYVLVPEWLAAEMSPQSGVQLFG